MFLIDSFIRFA